MRVLVDYRPALRHRSGVGEYAHHLVRSLLALFPVRDGNGVEVSLFSSSWKDRLLPSNELSGAVRIDCRVPGRILNFAWHRLGWPPVETLTGHAFDVTHSLHPLLMPARDAAQMVTIHDFSFLDHPERTRAEIRRDYGALARAHAHRADGIVVISQFTGREVQRRLGIPSDRIAVCTPGAPPWPPRPEAPPNGYILFLGTLEPRKNLSCLLDAYERMLARRRDVPRLVLAGKSLPESRRWLERISWPPLNGRVDYIGYVESSRRRALYEGARLLVQPSFDEGFGMAVLEAMTLGVPVVASNRGALPEVVGDAGPLVDADDAESLAAAMERLIDDEAFAAAGAAKGVVRSRQFSWDAMARGVYDAYCRAIANRCASA